MGRRRGSGRDRALLQQREQLLVQPLAAFRLDPPPRAPKRLREPTVWTALAEHLAALPDEFDTKAVLRRQERVVDEAWEFSRQDVQRTLPAVLSPVQLRILPWLPKMLYESDGKLNLQFLTGGQRMCQRLVAF